MSLRFAPLALAAVLAAGPAFAETCPSSAADKALIERFYTDVFVGRDVSHAPKYLTTGYIQHNPHVSPGLAGLMKDFGEGWKNPPPPEYKRVLLSTVADCDHHVVIYVRQTWRDKDGKARSHLSFDMFRTEGGLIAEHWDADD
jgi:predicted SnoaL-like aldol condensation-catalyzing enzyme